MQGLFRDYEEIRRSGLFDADYYLATYPDVAERNLDPLVHYLEEGAQADCNPSRDFDSAFYRAQCRQRGEDPGNPLIHYLRVGAARGFATNRDSRSARQPSPPASAEAAAPASQPTLVALEALGVTAGPGVATRLSASGWALASGPIADISVSLDGRRLGTAAYGLPRPDVARLYPDRAAAAACGFLLDCVLPPGRPGALELLLTVRTADGAVGERPLHVEIPPRERAVGIEDPHDGTRSAGRDAGKPALHLAIDRAAVDRHGMLQLEGYAVCCVEIAGVEAFIDGARIGAAEFGRVRDDVAEAHPDYPNARFSGIALVADIGGCGPGRKTLALKLTGRAGVAGEATATVTIPARAPAPPPAIDFYAHGDSATRGPDGRLVVSGWALGTSPVDSILVRLGDTPLGPAAIGLERPAIGNRYPALPHARRAGFLFDAPIAAPATPAPAATLEITLADGTTHALTIPIEADAPIAAGEPGAPGSAAPGDNDRALHVDTPTIIDGAAEAPVNGNLAIGGWALARAGVDNVAIAIDGATVAHADHGLRRLDVQAAFPERDDALTSGFVAVVPHRVLATGEHVVSVTLRDRAGESETTAFRITVAEPADDKGPWSLRRKMPQAEIDLGLRIVARSGRQPLFIAVLPVPGAATARDRAAATLASLCAQEYPDWRLLLVPGRAGTKAAAALLDGMGEGRGRGEILRAATPAALADAAARSGRAAADVFVAPLVPGDALGCDAFLEMAIAAALAPTADFFYSDERRRNAATGTVDAFFKPQWSPDLLLATNYIGRLWCARADLVGRLAEPDAPLFGRGGYDLVLRATEAATAIRHVPAVLCEAAPGIGDKGIGDKGIGDENAGDDNAAAVARALTRRGIRGTVGPGLVAGSIRLRRTLERPGRVSIIIPTRAAAGKIETCLETLRQLTRYPDYEIICIENIPAKDARWRPWLRRHADRVIASTEPFNWSRANNRAAAEARGQYLLFLNDDIEIVDPLWLDTLVAEAARPEIGVVGPRLLYPDRRVQHAGMFLAALGQARHAFRYAAEDEPGYFGLALTQRNVLAVTGACLLTRQDTFAALGGFDERHGVINNDIDFCLRAWRGGLFNLYTPHATLIHHEAVSRGDLADDYDAAAFDERWRDLFLSGDPFCNPRLSRHRDDIAIDREPTQLIVTGRPLVARDRVRNILVVKLDHIGDCVIAFPAVRRLKEHFPEARITVLTSHASQPIWRLAPSVAETIPFDFFHARSALGELERSEDDWRRLEQQLAPRRFDLAIDLRKHAETRPVLQHTGARHLAGFDFRGSFPWLDIAIEWSGDQTYARKHQHNGDDLINLVDAVAVACAGAPAAIALPPPTGRAAAAKGVTAKGVAGNGMTDGPLVCVHPTVGNDARQWPIDGFVAVIDRLVAEDGARIVLIGGPGDEAVAADIMRQVRRPERVASMVGAVPLAELPALLAGAALFLGNNSGPKHIAAGLGVPTVGIHSGTEDVREWGPVGPAAIAVARDMICAPCYLANAADCRRGLACLRGLEPEAVYRACKRLLLLTSAAPGAAPGSARPSAARPARAPRRRAR